MSVRPEPQAFELSQVTRDLIAARALIAKKGWAHGGFAETFFGIPVDPDSFFALRFCAGGAIVNVCGWGARRMQANAMLSEVIGKESIVEWNDNFFRTKEDVLAMFDAAILESMTRPSNKPMKYVCLATI